MYDFIKNLKFITVFIITGSLISCSNLNQQFPSQSKTEYRTQELNSGENGDSSLNVDHDEDEFPVSEVGNFRRADPFSLSCSLKANEMNCQLEGEKVAEVDCVKASLFYKDPSNSELKKIELDCVSGSGFDIGVPEGATDLFVSAEVKSEDEELEQNVQTVLPTASASTSSESETDDTSGTYSNSDAAETGSGEEEAGSNGEGENTDPAEIKPDFFFGLNLNTTDRNGEPNSAIRFSSDFRDPIGSPIEVSPSNGFKLGAWIRVDEVPENEDQMVFVKLHSDFDINIRWHNKWGFWSKILCGENPPDIRQLPPDNLDIFEWNYVELDVSRVDSVLEARLTVTDKQGSQIYSTAHKLDEPCSDTFPAVDRIKIGPAENMYKGKIDDVSLFIH